MVDNKKIEEFEQEVKKELADNFKEAEESLNEASDETRKELGEVFNQVKVAVLKLKDQLVALDINKDGVTLGDHLEEFTKNINETVTKTTAKISEAKLDEKSMDAWNKTKDAVVKASESIKAKAKEVYTNVVNKEKVDKVVDDAAAKVDEVVAKVQTKGEELYGEALEKNPEMKKVVDTVVDKTLEAKEFVDAKYQEFIHNPEVRKTVRTARDKVVEFTGNVVESVKEMFNNETEEEPEDEEEE